MNPRLLLAVILGGMTGVFTLTMLNGGLVSPASPGSILAVLAMTPKGAYFANIAAVCAAFAVSFVVSAFLLKTSKVKEDDDLEAATRRMQEMKSQSKGGAAAPASVDGDLSTVRKIIVACDAGMGSSAMGAGVLRKKVANAGLKNISVTNSAINSLPDDVDLVITHRDLTERAMRHAPQAQHISLTNFLDSKLYSDLVDRLLAANKTSDNQQKVLGALDDSFEAGEPNLFAEREQRVPQPAGQRQRAGDPLRRRAAGERRLRRGGVRAGDAGARNSPPPTWASRSPCRTAPSRPKTGAAHRRGVLPVPAGRALRRGRG